MESERTRPQTEIKIDEIGWREGIGKISKKPYRQLVIKDSLENWEYTAFDWEIQDPETIELIPNLKKGDALKIEYEQKKLNGGKVVRNLKGILDYESATDKPAESKRQDTGRSKDEMIARHVALKAAVDLRKGETAVVENDVLRTAGVFFDWLMGNDERFPGEEG